MIIKTRYPRTFEFYTEDHKGKETIVATKTLIHPDKSVVYKRMVKQGFTLDVKLYGWREKEKTN